MDPISLIGTNAYTAGLQKQAATQAAAVQGASAKSADLNKVRDAAEKFEAFFIGQMMEHMTAGLETDALFGGGHGEDMWKSMLNQEYGKEVAKTGRLGITEQVMSSMLKMQEERTNAAHAAVQPIATETTATDSNDELAQQDAAIALVAGARLPVKR
jgi:flagellar protein FlgJ